MPLLGFNRNSPSATVATSDRFLPTASAHSIERCAATISFGEEVPEKLFRSLSEKMAQAAAQAGLKKQPMIGFRFDLSGGNIIHRTEESSEGGPSTFASVDQSVSLMFVPNQISWSTTRYVRWRPFIGAFEEYFSDVLASVLDVLTPKGIRLEYLDRFFWGGAWPTFDISHLIKKESGYVLMRALRSRRQWHSHSGWFDKHQSFRRLTNVNIDVTDAIQGAAGPKPSVGILTVLQDELNIDGYGSTSPDLVNLKFIFGRFEDLHLGLKNVLSDIIVSDMATEIGLNSPP